MKRFILLLVALTWVLSACAPAQSTELSVPSQWKLFSFSDPDGETPVIDGSNITLSFDEDGKLGGNGGCNSYGGVYELKGQTLTISDLNSTLMACADQAMTDQEVRFIQALTSATGIEVAGDNLYIKYGDSQLNFVAGSGE
jgi:heat shock protein HslJ